MEATCKACVSMEELIRLLNECCHSGMTDVDWCRTDDIAIITFYN